MNVRRGGLGRGLGALIPTGPSEELIEGTRFEEVPLDSIEPNPRQPREVFDPEALAELVTSIREVGILQPIVVRELDPGRYQLIMGERRWRACREAGLDLVPAIVRDTADDALLRDALLENDRSSMRWRRPRPTPSSSRSSARPTKSSRTESEDRGRTSPTR